MDTLLLDDHYTQIPEDVIEQAAQMCSDDVNNSFYKVWNAGQGFKSAGMTPIYLLDQKVMQLIVVTTETFGKKLH
jgi:hypothetical protein